MSGNNAVCSRCDTFIGRIDDLDVCPICDCDLEQLKEEDYEEED